MPWVPAVGRRASSLGDDRARYRARGLVLVGAAVVLVPTLLWPPTASGSPGLQVEPVERATVDEPTPYGALPAEVRRAVDASLSQAGPTAITDPETVAAVRRYPYVAHEGESVRLEIYYGAGATRGGTLAGPLLVALGVTLGVLGWQGRRERSWGRLPPRRGLLVPGLTVPALWLVPTPGGIGGFPPAVGLAVAMGVLALPLGVGCRRRGALATVLTPLVGLAVAAAISVSLGASPDRLDEVVLTVAALTLPWYVLGGILGW